MRTLKKSFAATMVWGATMEGWAQQDCSSYDQGPFKAGQSAIVMPAAAAAATAPSLRR
jgi:hypothetical protein